MRIPDWRLAWSARYRDIPLLPNIAIRSASPNKQSGADISLTSLTNLTKASNSELDEPQPAPELDDEEPTSRQEWTRGVLFCAYGTSFVLLLNIILAGIAMSRTYGIYDSELSEASPIYEGDCSESKGWVTGLHLIINALSTIMLAATNYCMQCLGAPSRADTDYAHARQRWLEIGTPSIRNLRFFGRRHIILWLILLVTSLPIHLLYNSVVFSSLGTTEYPIFIASDNLDLDKPLLNSTELECFDPSARGIISDYLSSMAEGDFEYLSRQQCIDTFAVNYISGRGALVLLSNDIGENNDTVLWSDWGNMFYAESTTQYSWMCGESTQKCFSKDMIDSENWSVWGTSWRFPALDVEFPFPGVNRTSSFNTNSMFMPSHCLDTSFLSTDLCVDVARLEGFLLEYFRDRDEVNDFLRQSYNWQNSSWAAEVTVTVQEPLECSTSAVGLQPRMGYPIEGCLSHKTTESCQLLFSLPICLAVLSCNIIKVVCMFLTARDSRTEKFLTVGDAISSFLLKPDPVTSGRCLMSKLSLSSGPRPWKLDGISSLGVFRSSYEIPDSGSCFPEILHQRKRWFQAASPFSWIVTMIMGVTCLIVTGYLLATGTRDIKERGSSVDIKSLWDMGLGSATSTNLIVLVSSGVMPMVLLANTPQLIISVAYFLYNNLLTRMLLAAEHNDYATHRKPLRVSWPKGQQRSTYYLSLPYKFSLPLIASSALLHWLISQSLFYVQVVPVDVFKSQFRPMTTNTCGYSPMAIIFAIIVGGLMLLAGPVLGMRRLTSRMPLASNCSAAISAACHPPADDKDAAFKPVKWGEIPKAPKIGRISAEAGYSMLDIRRLGTPAAFDVDTGYDPCPQVQPENPGFENNGNGYPHCSFTSHEVVSPNPVRFYR